mmetsp:Transcript_48979/g.157409  ORF Transcript_48979/g.157409 Transcript_48979/m.157409 type:complete len:204 (-) Transcript_48979:348-959(-)
MQRERSTSSDDDNPTLTPHKRHRGGARPRVVYSKSYKLQVVHEALTKDPRARIKPTCHNHPGVGPAQLRKWIKKKDTLEVQARLERQVLKCRDDREYLRTVALTGLETRGGGGGGVSEPQAAPLPSRRAAAAVTPQKLGAHSCMPVALVPDDAVAAAGACACASAGSNEGGLDDAPDGGAAHPLRHAGADHHAVPASPPARTS